MREAAGRRLDLGGVGDRHAEQESEAEQHRDLLGASENHRVAGCLGGRHLRDGVEGRVEDVVHDVLAAVAEVPLGGPGRADRGSVHVHQELPPVPDGLGRLAGPFHHCVARSRAVDCRRVGGAHQWRQEEERRVQKRL